MKTIGISSSRRAFLLKTAAVAPAAAALGATTVGMSAFSAAAPAEPYKPTYFSADEWTTLNALVDRLIPADEEGPGALEAGVAEFIDRQMDTPYGHGQLWYMHGPFKEDLPALFGYQLHLAPRDLYRSALALVEKASQQLHGKAFSALDSAAKDEFLKQMESGSLKMEPVPSAAFFSQLLQNVHEGYFCDPKYGGNKDMAAWRMVGFPGARADYMDWVEQYGKAYPLPPVSLG